MQLKPPFRVGTDGTARWRRAGCAWRTLLAALTIAATIAAATIAAVAIAVARRGLLRFEVAGNSMSPTLSAGDWLVCEELSLRAHGRRRDPARGQIVVFESPLIPGLETIKRVVAVEGDVVSLDPGLGLRITTPEGSVQLGDRGPEVEPSHRIELGPGDVFVVGDNLAASTDSRDFGAVPASSIRAVVRWRYRRGRQ